MTTAVTPSPVDLPWRPSSALLAVIRSGCELGRCPLPDEIDDDPTKVHFAPGTWDGITTHHLARAREQDEARPGAGGGSSRVSGSRLRAEQGCPTAAPSLDGEGGGRWLTAP
jgi:hypothetical protein